MRTATDAAPDFGQRTDNTAKYGRAGGLEERLLTRFRRRLLDEVQALSPGRVLDAGCGEGHVTAWLADALPGAALTGVDGRTEAIAALRARAPRVAARQGNLLDLPFPDRSFDLVLCTEVLEHVGDPPAVLAELARVCSAHLLVTVPLEPFFRAGNLAAGRYVGRLGSTPGHRSTWGRRGFLRTVRAAAEPVRWIELFPWQGVVARPPSPQAVAHGA